MPPCDLLIKNATLFDIGAGLDLAVTGGRIAQLGPHLAVEAGQVIDAAGKLVIPAFVDSHTHLDKAFTVGEDDFATLQ